ncbi:MAG: GNAT family N-acetyltransferase [Gemmatimonadales bacterium]|nr:MAG: GNAT family N-acetyltransferase [Gemmatimonadales bacterium]
MTPGPRPHLPSSHPLREEDAETGPPVRIRLVHPEDIPAVIALSHRVYGAEGAWLTRELTSHQRIFPEGQLLAVHRSSRRPVGFAVTLLIDSRRFDIQANWNQITAGGSLRTHDPEGGDILYGAGIAVDSRARGMGIGKRLYAAREAMAERLGVTRIRAGARISGYRAVHRELDPFQYVQEVVEGKRRDPTLSFQLHMGFRVLGVALNYLPLDRESRGHAAVVEWRSPPRPDR